MTTRALQADEKRVYDLLVRSGGCTRYWLELRLNMPVKEIANVLRRLTRHGYAKTGWPERSNHLWLPALPSESKSAAVVAKKSKPLRPEELDDDGNER